MHRKTRSASLSAYNIHSGSDDINATVNPASEMNHQKIPSITTAVSGLKISSNHSSGSHKNDTGRYVTAAQPEQVTRRRLSVFSDAKTSVQSLDGSEAARSVNSASAQTLARRRLSVMAANQAPQTLLDGLAGSNDEINAIEQQSKASMHGERIVKKLSVKGFASLSKVGFVPFNPNKVNQDRVLDLTVFETREDRALVGVFDGHGAVGHQVSEYLRQKLPSFVSKNLQALSNIPEALTNAFIECHNSLVKGSGIDCTFSGSTATVCFISNGKIYSCNAGDSRAVLGRRSGGTWKAIALSFDQKPERTDERKRIIDAHGRVEACKGSRGENIGPLRVWLLHQDVPGLAMTRSFGDTVAQSVGVIPKPEIVEHTIVEDEDKFVLIGSDGIWEFITNAQAVQIASSSSSPEEACRALVDEATRRWHREEEVVDDISVAYITL